MKKTIDSEPMFDNKYLNSKVQSYNIKVTTNFHSKKPEECDCIFLSIIVIDSVFKLGKNYYPQTFLEEWKYRIKKKNINTFTIDDAEISSSGNGDDD